MSRLAKKPIILPKGVNFALREGNAVVGGPKGEVKFFVHENIEIKQNNEELLVVSKPNNQKNNKALLGTMVSILKNSIKGVTDGFEKKLEIEGIGYKAQLEGENLSLSLGFTHPIKIKAPKGISFKVEKNVITISGINKEVVGQIASTIRLKKPPEPYKGKGIHYLGEIIRRKAGKKAVGTA
ncbi:MAG TPA: 50S ribosomal protein L6 [Candidatus Paceibacterota bacterium]